MSLPTYEEVWGDGDSPQAVMERAFEEEAALSREREYEYKWEMVGEGDWCADYDRLSIFGGDYPLVIRKEFHFRGIIFHSREDAVEMYGNSALTWRGQYRYRLLWVDRNAWISSLPIWNSETYVLPDEWTTRRVGNEITIHANHDKFLQVWVNRAPHCYGGGCPSFHLKFLQGAGRWIRDIDGLIFCQSQTNPLNGEQ